MSIETAARKAAHVWTRFRTTNKVGLSLKVTLDALVSAVEAADHLPAAGQKVCAHPECSCVGTEATERGRQAP